MTVERSERGALTTNANYIRNVQEMSAVWNKSGNQWTIENNTLLSTQISFQLTGFNAGEYYNPVSLNFVGTTAQNHALEWGYIARYYNSYTGLYESNFYPSNTPIQVDSAVLTSITPQSQWPAWTIYIRRVDGGILTPSDMERSFIKLIYTRQKNVELQTNPSSWYETTTATFQNPMETYTTIIPTDYDISSSQYDPLLEIPSKIDTAINFIILGFGRIMNFRYISFVVCFVLIVGLVAWLIH